MKFNLLIFILLMTGFGFLNPELNAQTIVPFSSRAAKNLRSCLLKKDLFTLRSGYDKVKDQLSACESLYFKAYIHNSFNQCTSSRKEIRKLLLNFSKELGDSIAGSLLKLQIDNEVKTFRYRKAAEISYRLLNKYSRFLDSTDIDDVKNSAIIWQRLAATPVQKTILPAKSHVIWKRDIANLMTVPVSIGTQISDFVFDTGANFCTISRTYARRFNLEMLETSFKLGSSTGINTIASLAVARVLKIGNIELRNVVFLVLPDDQLIFPKINYTIHGIIGFPVISQFEELHISKTGVLTVSKNSGKSSLRNLAFDGLVPIISLRTDRDTLAYRFDSGAQQSELFSPYFQKYKAEVTSTGIADSINRGGAGGNVRVFSYKVPQYKVYANDHAVYLKNVTVLLAPAGDEQEYYYGNIGRDFIDKFKEMVINFRRMFISFSDDY